jgi:hypothetical protein
MAESKQPQAQANNTPPAQAAAEPAAQPTALAKPPAADPRPTAEPRLLKYSEGQGEDPYHGVMGE